MAQAQPVPNPICGPSIRGIVSPSTSPLQAAYADFIGSLTRRSPLAIPIDPHPFAFEDRAEHVKGVLGAVSAYVGVLLDDMAQNALGGLDRRQIDALLSDLSSEVAGQLQKAADDLSGRVR